MLSYTDLKKGVTFLWNDKPYEVIESSFSRMQQRKAVVQAKIRDLATGKILEMSFQPSNQFVEAVTEKRTLVFRYHHRGEYLFSHSENPRERFPLAEDAVGDKKRWLKKDTAVTALFFREKLLTLTLPIKMDLVVSEAPPGIQGDRSQGGTKAVTLETGATIQVPLFINEGDVVRVNTETGEYTERVKKSQ
ncbi:MAG: elongation factor P [Patescibacteria group bacterium]